MPFSCLSVTSALHLPKVDIIGQSQCPRRSVRRAGVSCCFQLSYLCAGYCLPAQAISHVFSIRAANLVQMDNPMASEAHTSLNRRSSLYKIQNAQSPEKAYEVSSLAEEFSPNKQSWKLFKQQGFRLFFTLLLIALYIMTFVIFESYNIVSHDQMIWYNTVSTIINLALGLNFLEAFKDMAKVLRWRVLANRSFTVREVDLILGGESLLNLGTLMWESMKKPLTLLVCASWIALNLLAQGSVALISLNAPMDSGTGSTGTYYESGNVKTAKVDCFYVHGRCPVNPGPQMTTANTFGQAVQGQISCPYQDDADIMNAPQSCTYFYGSDTKQGEFAYRFNEYNPSDSAQAYPYLTNRNIRASAGQCYQYDIDWANSPTTSDQDGTNDIQLFKFGNSSYTAYLPIPKIEGAFHSTTYVYNGTSAPQHATLMTCGPRCMTMYALRLGANTTDPTTAMFECPLTISNVNSATADYQEVPDYMALIAASSIALSGRFVNTPNRKSWAQYQLYTFGNYFETQGDSAQQVGRNMAEFAIGALTGMANINPSQLVPGTLPILGYHLNLKWKYIIPLAVCIGGVHLILIMLTVWIARPIVIPDKSNLALARLLYPLVGRLEGRGSLLDGKKLTEAIQASGSKGGQIVYGVKGEGENKSVLLDEGVQVRKSLKGGVFPRGQYA